MSRLHAAARERDRGPILAPLREALAGERELALDRRAPMPGGDRCLVFRR